MRNKIIARPRHWLVRSLAILALAGGLSALAQPTSAPSRLDYSSFKIISDRNIFNPNRSPRTAGRIQRPPSARAKVDSFSLLGTMSYEKGDFAFFDGTSSEYRKALQPDGDIAGFKVTAIAPNSAKLVAGTNEFELRIGWQLRREDEGDWFVSTGTETFPTSRTTYARTRSGNTFTRGGSVTTSASPQSEGGPDGTVTGAEPPSPGGPDAAAPIVTPDPQSEPAAASPATGTDSGGGESDVLRRLMQRREELSQ